MRPLLKISLSLFLQANNQDLSCITTLSSLNLTWMMLFSALAFGTSAASGFLWGSREQNLSPSSHLLSENSWKLRLKTALPLGFTFLCLSTGVTGASCLEQPPGTTQALAADHRLVCLKYFPDIPFLWKDSPKKKRETKTLNQSRNTQNQTIPPKISWRRFLRSLLVGRIKLSLHCLCGFMGCFCT